MTNSPVIDEINSVAVEAENIGTEYGKNFKILPTNDQVKGIKKFQLLNNVLVFDKMLFNYRIADYFKR